MSLNTLNESLDIIANLVIPRLEDDVDVIQKLDDEPNDVGGLTAAELKAKFDEAANIIKTYLNETLVPQLSDTVAEAEVRAQAEAERIANERARVEGENLREEAEDAREENEDARVQAEEARVSAESGRVAAESSRSSAESTRQNNEQERQSQESTRQANEETRQSQESTRQTNEQTRQTQEQARATAEAQRAAAEATRRNTFATELSQAQTARSAAEAAAKAADEDAQYVEETKDLSKSWAVGGTGTREGEDTNNAMYWSERAKNYAGGGVNSFNGRNGAVVPKTGDYTAEQVGADPKGTADAKVSEHNTSEASHQDLRLALSGHLASKNNPHNVTAEQVGAIAAGAVGNVHVWQRVQTYADPVPEVPAGYTLGEVETDVLLVSVTSNPGNQSKSVLLYYDSSLNVTNDGIISVSSSNYVYANVTNMNAVNRIVGQFVSVETIGTAVEETDLKEGEIYYVPEDCEISYSLLESPLYIRLSKVQRVTGHPYQPAIPAGTHTDYLTSTDPNAYPKQSAEGGQDAHYVLGDVVSGSFKLSPGNNDVTIWDYATGITISDDGVITLTNPTQISLYDSNTVSDASVLKGMFVNPFAIVSSPFVNGEVYFIPSDATISKSTNLLVNKYQPVTGYPAIPANTVITYLGQLGEPGARIEVGSYVGTGTYGQSNPNSLTFGFEPKIVFFANAGVWPFVNPEQTSVMQTIGASGSNTINISWDGKSVSWYSDDYHSYQLNTAGETYYYIAIG